MNQEKSFQAVSRERVHAINDSLQNQLSLRGTLHYCLIAIDTSLEKPKALLVHCHEKVC